jgi:small subunit ribosomal protein S6
MSAVKNTYELTYIVNAVINDDQIKDLVNRVSSYISESGGEIIETDEWGSRRLAFPIQKKRNGYYVNMYFHASGAVIARLERALEIDDNILRYLTLRMDAKMLRHYENRKSAIAEAGDESKAEKPKPEASKETKEEKPKAKGADEKKSSEPSEGPAEGDAGEAPEETPDASDTEPDASADESEDKAEA